MRFLVDQNVSYKVAHLLVEAEYDSVHVRAFGLEAATDSLILARAAEEDRVIITGDSDFGSLLAQSAATRPSVIFLRRVQGQRAVQQAGLVLDNLPAILDDLTAGALVVCAPTLCSASEGSR